MLSYRTIQPHTLELLRKLMNLEILKDLRLVGGTSLALQLGHRQSIDLDLFGVIKEDNESIRKALMSIGKIKVRKETEHLKLYSIDDIKVDIVDYSYPWLDPAIIEDDLRLASPRDIGAMKINAIDGRGTKKDFLDVYFLLHKYKLHELLDWYCKKYEDHSLFRAIMSLTYFADAEPQLMPKMFKEVEWQTVKETIIDAVSNLNNSN